MSRFLQVSTYVVGALLLFAAPAMAQEEVGGGVTFSDAFGAGIIILGAGWGIGRIGAAAVESIARQPEASRDVSGAMLLSAALIEGATFFALIVLLAT